MAENNGILFILRKSAKYTYSSFGLSNSATFVVNKLNDIGYTANIIQVTDSNEIDRVVTQYNPKIIIIEALWVPPTKIAELLKIHKERKWIIRIHSKAPFLAMEGIAFNWIISYLYISNIYKKKLFISCNNIDFNNEINATRKIGAIYLPNIYCPNQKEFYIPKSNFHNDVVDIGCFGAIRPLKNQLLQALAAVKFGIIYNKKICFHINGNRTEQMGENVLKNLRWLFSDIKHELIEHDWCSHEDFLNKIIPTMDIGMQVSLTESFNIITADFIHAGIPIVVSYDVDWMPSFTKANPNSTKDIIHKLHIMYLRRGKMATFSSRQALKKYNHNATEQWKKILNEI